MATKARLDADRTAQPKTRLLGHGTAGHCLGPGSVSADTLENVETGERTPLTSPEPVDPKNAIIVELAKLLKRCEPHIYQNERLDRLHADIETALDRADVKAITGGK